LVGEIARELHPSIEVGPPRLESSLDRDLAFDSLGRMELMHRVESEFGVSLPETVLASAETPGDLLRALGSAAPRAGGAPVRAPFAVSTAAGREPALESADLVDVMEFHAARHPDHPHIRLYEDDGDGEIITHAELWQSANRVAAGLQALGLAKGETVALMLPTGRAYFESFMGTLIAGGVPVPVYPPGRTSQIEEHLMRHVAILDNGQVRVLIADPAAKNFARLIMASVETLSHVVTPEEITHAGAAASVRPALAADDTAFLQYTSGSTGAPKGVILSHANLLANIRSMGRTLKVGPDDVFVSWLPLYHDMGLIGAWLGSLHFGVPLVLMSPLSFLSRPVRWLQAIHRYNGTISGAPNFAYEMCLARIPDDALAGLDLSSWRVAFNGAEPVIASTVERFITRFEAYGFRRTSMMPVYGLAENSVGLAFSPLDRGPRIDRVVRTDLAEAGIATPASENTTDVALVPGCGFPIPGHQIRIVDATGQELPDRREGRIQFRGPSSTRGYFRSEEKTRALFAGEWLDADDAGYTVDGELFVTARTKDMIIRAGRNIFPAEFEAAIGEIDGIQRGNVAVFGVADEATGTERVIVLAESRRRTAEATKTQRDTINELAWELIGGPPDDVQLVPPRTVPKTSSGKIRRQAAKQVYLSGTAGRAPDPVWRQILHVATASVRPSSRRFAGTVAAYVFASYGWLVLALVGLIAWPLVVVTPGLALRWAIVRGVVGVLAFLTRTPISIAGQENLPAPDQSFIAVANHCSYLDGLAVAVAVPRPIRFVAKSELLGSFIARVFLQRIGSHFVERFDTRKSLSDAERAATEVRKGGAHIYFPEATFSRMPGLLPFQMGAFAAAAEAGVPVVPIAIRGTRAMLRGDSGFLRPGRIDVKIGEPIMPGTDAGGGVARWQEAVRLRDVTRAAILNDCGEPDLGHERAPFLELAAKAAPS
jgi:1-acyl-sn-glycerol-3-phosphate acyltransferase